ncbi:hypothetical protein GCM10027170_38380 [Aliiglaciecola aliphaticivorans]
MDYLPKQSSKYTFENDFAFSRPNFKCLLLATDLGGLFNT